MLRSTETMPVPSRGSSTVVLSTSNSRSEPSLGSTSSSSRASGGRFDRGARQRRREQHVVQLDGAPAALALLLGRGKQLLGARVGDDQPAFGVGEQNRVGDGVDDREEQRALAPQLADLLGEAAAAADLLDLLAEHGRQPADVGGRTGARAGAAAGRARRRRPAVAAQRNGGERSGAERRRRRDPADVAVDACRPAERRPARRGQGARPADRAYRSSGQEKSSTRRWARRRRRCRSSTPASLSTARQTERFTPAWRASHSRLACAQPAESSW